MSECTECRLVNHDHCKRTKIAFGERANSSVGGGISPSKPHLKRFHQYTGVEQYEDRNNARHTYVRAEYRNNSQQAAGADQLLNSIIRHNPAKQHCRLILNTSIGVLRRYRLN